MSGCTCEPGVAIPVPHSPEDCRMNTHWEEKSHRARPIRKNGPGAVWSAGCPCGWTATARWKEEAEQRADEHNGLALCSSQLVHVCYQEDAMEYGDESACAACVTGRLLERRTA